MLRSYGEDFGELLEDTETDESDEAFGLDEAARRSRRWNKLQVASSGKPMPQQVGQGYATKADLNNVWKGLDARIGVNSKAIATVDARTRSIEAEAAKLRVAVRREITERKASTDSLKKGLDDLRQISMLLPLLSTATPKTVGGTPNVLVDNGDMLSKLLPIMLMSGGLGGNGGGGGMFGSGDGGIGMMAMMLALTSKS